MQFFVKRGNIKSNKAIYPFQKTGRKRQIKKPCKPLKAAIYRAFDFWQGQKESNPQPTVLETATLPVELYPYGAENEARTRDPNLGKVVLYH